METTTTVTEKISIREAMKTAFHLWKKHFLKIILVGLIVYIPTQLCIELISTQIDPENFRLANSVYTLIRELIGAVALLGIISFIVRILENKEEKEQSVREILRHGMETWPIFIGKCFIAGFKILGYTLLLIVPGIYKSVRLSFLDCVVATNDDDTINELDESERLVKNRWWKVFSFLLLTFFLAFFLEILLVPLIFLVPESHILSFFIGVIILLLQTYFIVVRATYYISVKKLVPSESKQQPYIRVEFKQKTDKELEIISKDHAFYSRDERYMALQELELRNSLTDELSEMKRRLE